MSLWDKLTPEQKEKALAYTGPESIGDPSRLHYVSIIAQKDRVIERQAEAIDKLRAALKPFAEVADDIPADKGCIGDGLCAPTVHKSAIFDAARVFMEAGNE